MVPTRKARQSGDLDRNDEELRFRGLLGDDDEVVEEDVMAARREGQGDLGYFCSQGDSLVTVPTLPVDEGPPRQMVDCSYDGGAKKFLVEGEFFDKIVSVCHFCSTRQNQNGRRKCDCNTELLSNFQNAIGT